METVAVTDFYHASYLLLSGCALTGIECNPVGVKSIVCTMYFSGQNVAVCNENWLTKQATVNLMAFRRAYAQVHTFIDQAKKGYFRHGEVIQ